MSWSDISLAIGCFFGTFWGIQHGTWTLSLIYVNIIFIISIIRILNSDERSNSNG